MVTERSRWAKLARAAPIVVLLLIFGCSGGGSATADGAGSPVLDCSGFSAVGSSADSRGWLEAHNTRRQCYHEHNNLQFVALTWSPALATSSQEWAETLVGNGCRLQHCANVLGRSQCQFGENLAFHRGFTQNTDQILRRWTENEATFNGGHFTQVLWRPTRYVGCGWASSACGEVQVCRYIKPGNCNSLSYLVDDSPCGPSCPPDGCSANVSTASDYRYSRIDN